MLCQRRLGNSSLSMSMSPPKCMVFGLTGSPCNRFFVVAFPNKFKMSGCCGLEVLVPPLPVLVDN